jgi:tRNA dimethylallyltransferase
MLRALEVYHSCGRPLSSFEANAAEKHSNFNFIIIGLSRPRDELYRRINLRCAEMFKHGLPAELKSLFEAGYTPDDPGLRAIGYREFFIETLEDRVSSTDKHCKWRLSEDTEGVQALIAQNSRRYTKRQITFFIFIPNVNWLEAGDNDEETSVQIRKLLLQSLK